MAITVLLLLLLVILLSPARRAQWKSRPRIHWSEAAPVHPWTAKRMCYARWHAWPAVQGRARGVDESTARECTSSNPAYDGADAELEPRYDGPRTRASWTMHSDGQRLVSRHLCQCKQEGPWVLAWAEAHADYIYGLGLLSSRVPLHAARYVLGAVDSSFWISLDTPFGCLNMGYTRK